MIINGGTKYEGKSSNYYLEDGIYNLQIVEIEEEATLVRMTLVTSSNKRVFKRFYLTTKDGETNTRALAELSDFVTTALQIDDEEATIELMDALGCYVQCSIRNGSYKDANGVAKPITYCDKPHRIDGFEDDKPSLLAKYQKGRKAKNRPAAKASVKKVEEQVEEVEEEETGDIDLAEFLKMDV